MYSTYNSYTLKKWETVLIIVCLFVCFYGRPPEGRKVGVPIRDSASRPGLALVTPPSRHWTWEQNKHSYLLGQFKSLHHNNSCALIPLIARNLAGWTFVCPRRNLVHPAPENNNALVLRYSADPLKAVSGLRLVPYPRAILKIRQPSSLVYRPCYGVLPTYRDISTSLFQQSCRSVHPSQKINLAR